MKCVVPLCLLVFLFCGASCQTAPRRPLAVGDTIPAFTLSDQDGNRFSSTDYLGKSALVIFFYPKDESMVCTREACGFRDHYAELTKAGAVVIGINGGTIESHRLFGLRDNLPYPLLVDSGNTVLKAFGIPRRFFMTGRQTYVVDKSGKIVFTYSSAMNGARHAEEALAYLKTHPEH